ncbi:hypothetical protein BV372_17935 [Nostoc sp. T09]|uniref:hypothetical protein n=1 Tax=Nostoc sp. T09 TaxID=1932621 RepID=UPI000A3A6246|nr:hypothetical protein [Nostoc sp. T09]OUL33058.1 hypothetical protein BV372_17935 [Nostoc sp. T09]
MTETKHNHIVRQGRLFPEIQWTEEQKTQWRRTLEEHYQRCKIIFERLQPELLKTHYKWFMAVEAESGDYFIDQNEEIVTQMCLQKYPNAIPFIFVINETGVAGRI